MIATILLLLLAGFAGWFGSSVFHYIEIAGERIARKKSLTILLSALLPVAIRLALLPVIPIPIPQAHDEFSHLLAADTFTHGRLANPVPPAASHFESIHILVRPSYVSVFPPAQGSVLAVGKIFTNSAWPGVLLSIALMTAAICWMLQAWVSPGWALPGTILLVIRLDVFSYWANSYWGGAVAATGGALILGALRRLQEKRSVADSLWLGIGIAILANSRPFEGAVFTALSLCFLLYKTKPFPLLWPTAAVVLVAIGFMALDSYSRTGNPLLPPYVLYRSTIANAPHFTLQNPRPEQPHWDDPVLADFYTSEIKEYQAAHGKPFQAALTSAQVSWRFYIGFLYSVPLIVALFDKKARLLFALLAAFFLIALAPQVWHNPHYAAPATGLIFLLVTLGMQKIRSWRFGQWLTRTLMLASIIFMIRIAGVYPANNAGSRWSGWAKQEANGFDRSAIVQRLGPAQRHLVIVRYALGHDSNREWVYNDADIDAARVVWARDKGPSDNGDLLQHFKERQIWLLEPDLAPPRLVPYPVH
jgi:hypothetical protein